MIDVGQSNSLWVKKPLSRWPGYIRKPAELVTLKAAEDFSIVSASVPARLLFMTDYNLSLSEHSLGMELCEENSECL